MVFLDVTSSCKSASISGMQRMTRRIHAELAAPLTTTPVCWNYFGHTYQRLGHREIAHLTKPFCDDTGASTPPVRWGESGLAEWWRCVFRRRLGVGGIKTDDVLLVPDFFGDERTQRIAGLLRTTKAASLAIFHDAAVLRLPALHSSAARARFRRYLQALAQFDLVVCISREAEEDLLHFWAEFGATRTRTCVEKWPVDFDPTQRGGESENPSGAVLFVSTLHPRKGHLTLLRAAESLWNAGIDFRLQLIGRSDGAWGERVLGEVRRLQHSGRSLVWLNQVADSTLHRAYRDCIFTVYPSLSEGCGLPILESLWHGKPCICGRNGALGEAAAGGGCLLVDQTNPAALADGIARLLTDHALQTQLQTKARNRHFRTWTDYRKRLIDHLRELRPSLAEPLPAT